MDDIKQKAQERGRKLKLPYAGALLPAEAHALMQEGAKLVDVRTDAELHYVGSVPGSEAIEWNTYPEGQRNPAFLEQLAEAVRKDEPVMFLCRSGVRSHHAAIAADRRPAGKRPTTSSKDSKATRTPTGSATRSAAGASRRPALDAELS